MTMRCYPEDTSVNSEMPREGKTPGSCLGATRAIPESDLGTHGGGPRQIGVGGAVLLLTRITLPSLTKAERLQRS